jgi:hypothetical protein
MVVRLAEMLVASMVDCLAASMVVRLAEMLVA